jgi:MoxR-like ATPase
MDRDQGEERSVNDGDLPSSASAAAGPDIDEATLARAAGLRDALRREIAKVYVGSAATVDLLLTATLARGHVLLEGVPGIAKTTLAKAYASALGCSYSRIQFTPDLLPADITGTYVLNLQTNTFQLRQGPIFAHVVLGDEINRAPAKTQSALLEAMQEGQVTIEGDTRVLPSPFVVLATQNPVEHEGVYDLPEAQVDRFVFKVLLGYPSFAEEREMLLTYSEAVPAVSAVLDPAVVIELSDAAERVHVAPELLDYIVRLVQATRDHECVLLGASPRASLALMRCAKAHALLSGRSHVLPDDIRDLAHHALVHRLILTPEAELDRVGPSEVIKACLTAIPYSD